MAASPGSRCLRHGFDNHPVEIVGGRPDGLVAEAEAPRGECGRARGGDCQQPALFPDAAAVPWQRLRPTASMPTGLRWFAECQPVTPVTQAVRGLLAGDPIGPVPSSRPAGGAAIALLSYLWARRLFSRHPQPVR